MGSEDRGAPERHRGRPAPPSAPRDGPLARSGRLGGGGSGLGVNGKQAQVGLFESAFQTQPSQLLFLTNRTTSRPHPEPDAASAVRTGLRRTWQKQRLPVRVWGSKCEGPGARWSRASCAQSHEVGAAPRRPSRRWSGRQATRSLATSDCLGSVRKKKKQLCFGH